MRRWHSDWPDDLRTFNFLGVVDLFVTSRRLDYESEIIRTMSPPEVRMQSDHGAASHGLAEAERPQACATIAICVPARNEAALLPRLLMGLAAQEGGEPFVLCLLLDGCTDESDHVIAMHRDVVPFDIVTQHIAADATPNAGRARAAAMAFGLETVGADGILLSTDADSVPAPDWVATNLTALEIADVAVGLIVRSGGAPSPVQDRIEAYYDGLARLRRMVDPVPWESTQQHHYTSAASLACSAQTYTALGGFEPIPASEDGRLVDTAHRLGLRVRRDAMIRVETSTRREGRALGGLAGHLRDMDRTGGASARMAHPDDVAWRYARHALARACWPMLDTTAESLAAALHRPVADILAAASAAPNAESFAMQVVPDIPGGERLVDLATAEAALSALLLRHAGADA